MYKDQAMRRVAAVRSAGRPRQHACVASMPEDFKLKRMLKPAAATSRRGGLAWSRYVPSLFFTGVASRCSIEAFACCQCWLYFIYTYIHTHNLHRYAQIRACVYIYIYIYVSIYVRRNIHVHIHIHMYIYIYTHIYMHAYMFSYTYMYKHHENENSGMWFPGSSLETDINKELHLGQPVAHNRSLFGS